MIYKCKGKKCKKVWAFDYPEMRVVNRGYGRTDRIYSRISDHGRVDIGYDGKCPACGGQNIACGRVKGYTTDHVCDARCTSATGHQCECSCGGKNHGKEHLAA